jgi:thiol-disulfide isomerase/thioredoxin
MILGATLALVMIAVPLFAQAPPAAAPAAPAVAAPAPPPQVVPPRVQKGPKAAVGSQYADFEVPAAFENKMVKFSDIFKSASQKKLTVITFTNTTCSSCQAEVAVLAQLKMKHKDLLQVVVVVTDFNAKRITDNLGADVKNAFNYWLSDPGFSVPLQHGFKSTPATVYIAGNGKILDLQEGFVPTEEGQAELVAKIEGYLK